jgi:putative ABC transport system permease protein
MVVTPRIKFGVLLGQEELSIPALGYAIDPAKEIEIVGLNKRIVEGEYLDSFSNCAILGSELRKRLGVEVGDTMTIITRTAYDAPTGINLRIVGTFSLGIGGMDRNIFYMPLRVGQKVLDLEGRATEIVVILKDQNKSIEYARNLTLGDNYSVVPFQYNPIVSYMSIIGRIYSIIYAIILLVACSTIANTMMMVVFERRREIGMIKALGLTNGSIVGLLVIEAALIGLVGSTIGALIGGITSYWLKYHGVNIAEMSSAATASMPFGPIIYLLPTPLTVGGAFLFGLLATIIVALFPISRVTKLEPAKALRSI